MHACTHASLRSWGELIIETDDAAPAAPRLGYLLTILRCRREQLASSAEEVILQETKKEICQILDLMFDVATNTRVLELLRAVQTKFADTHPVVHGTILAPSHSCLAWPTELRRRD